MSKESGATVDFSGFDEIIKRVKEASPRLVAEMEAARDRIFDNAEEEAPVKTGAFKESLEKYTILTAKGLKVGVISDVEYAKYIKGKKQNGKSTVQTLLIKPTKEAAKQLSKDCAAEIADAIKGR